MDTGTLIMIGQFLLGITILVGIHEAGHMLFAKIFGMRVEKYSIGFPPVLAWFQKGETKYQIGLLPLGGFVKIAGMVDESMDAEQMAEAPKSWEFRSKPTWQRLLVMLGGVIFNIILGCIIFTSLTYKYGTDYLPIEKAANGIYAGDLALAIGLQTGDKVVKVNGESISKFDEIMTVDVLLNEGSYYTVNRGGEIIDVPIPDSMMNALSSKEAFFLTFDFNYLVGESQEGGKAYSAGLKPGDKLLAIDSMTVPLFSSLKGALDKSRGKTVNVSVLRGQDSLNYNIAVNDQGQLGFAIDNLMAKEFRTQQYSLTESFVLGSSSAFSIVVVNLKGIGKMIKGDLDPNKAAMGVTGMTKMYGDEFRSRRFWGICGMLSMALALFNLFPIPGLDGGHVVFLTYEMVTGRKASQKVQEISLKIGFTLLISLMIYVNVIDAMR
jgi:regulator of sigma E protease